MKKQIYLTVALCLLAPAIILALTIEEYASNLDNSFYDGTINVTILEDKMIDTDSDGQNDTLIFNLTTDYSTLGTFTVNIFFEDESMPALNDTRVISSSNPSFYMNISTFYLSDSNYSSYFVRVYNQIGQRVYESKKLNTSNYTAYETGTNISEITDENVDNNLIRVRLTLNVKRNETVNISVNLGYNNKTISSTQQSTLMTPSQSVDIDFDNETIKSTHYNGIYSLESVRIGEKIIKTSYSTSSYNYEDFAKTSYIKSISSGAFDNNSNNLSDALQFNFTLNIKSAETYSIEAALYGSEEDYITTIAKNETLSVGTQQVTIEIDGNDIYSTYYNGEFKLSFVKLSVGEDTKDVIYDAHTTNATYYTDFERPALPDLAITVNTSFLQSANTTNITINVSNIGESPAFNIFIDIFDNNTYENQSAISYLDVNESRLFNFTASNTTDGSIFTAIVDFDNYVDESNESNNIAQNRKQGGESCLSGSECVSNHCDNDGVGWTDDGWCFSIESTYYDGQDSKCEESARSANDDWCDEKRNEALSTCDKTGQNHYEDTCSDTCVISDKDNICRSSDFAVGCTADAQCNGITAGTNNCDSICRYIPPDQNKFVIKNTAGGTVAWLGDYGNIILKGTCSSGGACTAPDNSFIFKDSSGNEVAHVDSNGNLCIETGDCSDNSANCNNPTGDSFIVKDSSDVIVSYIDEDGDLCLTGSLIQNGIP